MIVENGLALRPLDLDAVQAFVLVADLASFTRAAEALDTTQSAVSLKLKRLEGRLGRRLLERTPRRVRLSAEGVSFLDAARELLHAHERALGSHVSSRMSLRIGIGDQAAGTQLPTLLAKVGAYDRALRFEVRIGTSRSLLAVSPLTRRTCPPLAVDVGARLGLPQLPPIEITLYTRTTEPRTREAIRILVAALRTTISN